MAPPRPILPLLLALALAGAAGVSAAAVKSNIMLATIPGGHTLTSIILLACSETLATRPGASSSSAHLTRLDAPLPRLASTRPWRTLALGSRSPRRPPPSPSLPPNPGWSGIDFIQAALTAARVPNTLVLFSAPGTPNMTALLAPGADGVLPFSGFMFYPNVEVVGNMLGADLVQVRTPSMPASASRQRGGTCQ